MDTQEALDIASNHLRNLSGHIFDLLTVGKPASIDAAGNLAKVVSKLSPILGNLIEFNTIEFLNDITIFHPFGNWIRQDPGFPDALFQGSIDPAPGFEIKAWFPLATEITARFKDSQNHFLNDETRVVLLAWLPEMLLYGKPRIIDVCIVSGRSVAEARDIHYHNPPDYLVLEPNDTTDRTANLQQTNTSGYKWQGTDEQFAVAEQVVESWGPNGKSYQPTLEYQEKVLGLYQQFPYRLDTNYAKMDRIVHAGIETFKASVLEREVHGMSIKQWARLLYRGSEETRRRALEEKLDIRH